MRTPRWITMLAVGIVGLLWTFGSANAEPLRRHPTNPRYFTDGSGKAIFLTGSHTHTNLVDMTTFGSFDFDTYLNFLVEHHHNFVRVWAWENSVVDLFPYPRTGPGTAMDGRAKFDVSRFNQTYFDRLRSRVIALRDRGIYASIMLFQGWSIEQKDPCCPFWLGHPFNAANNINRINGDANRDGQGEEVHTLEVPAVTALQEAYIRKVIDTVNDLDNVLYEVSNESDLSSADWQYHVINTVKAYESTKLQQHPVGMTGLWDLPLGNAKILSSNADWVSLGSYGVDLSVADGSKVLIQDTDHTGYANISVDHVWQLLTRGQNYILMDFPSIVGTSDCCPMPSSAADVRFNMGYALTYARRIDLAQMPPHAELCSTAFCLANPGYEYLVYLPNGGSVTVNLSGGASSFSVEWFDPGANSTQSGFPISAGVQTLSAPFSGRAVLYLRSGPANDTPLPAPPTGLRVR